MITEYPFDPLAVLQALHDADVAFVVIGGVAARLHGSPSLTRDVDICHARDNVNLQRLSGVLVRLHARLRGVDDDVPFLLDALTLSAGANFTFSTDAGSLDILAAPAGASGYDELASTAIVVDLGSFSVHVARLDDLIRMKQAAGRPKDRVEVEILAALRDELEGEESDASGRRGQQRRSPD